MRRPSDAPAAVKPIDSGRGLIDVSMGLNLAFWWTVVGMASNNRRIVFTSGAGSMMGEKRRQHGRRAKKTKTDVRLAKASLSPNLSGRRSPTGWMVPDAGGVHGTVERGPGVP